MRRLLTPQGFLALVVVALLAAGGATLGVRMMREASAAKRELAKQAAEMEECRERLTRFHAAWTRYRKGHGGAEPPSPESLVPRYVPDGALLACPTAARWRAEGRGVDQGSIKLGGKDFAVTYGFLWLSAAYGPLLSRSGEEAPLVICGVHRETVYRAVYGKMPPLGTFDEEKFGLAPDVARTPVLAVRRSGKVDTLARGEL